MNALRKMTNSLSKKWLLVLSVCFFALILGTQPVLANPEGSNTSFELQQTIQKVEGVVKDDKGEPLVGVSVIVKGTTSGTVTDIDGRYTLNINTPNPIVVFTYIGYKQQSITPTKTVLNIVMEEDSKMMSEVVVVGYGLQKKENLTGAVSSVRVDETLGSRPIADVGRGLQGAVPGLTVTIPSGEVGSDPTMKIRGQVASLVPGSSSAPLLLVDNVEVPSIQMINPDDIESISVLKDAASTSIYGSKAAFGVILITTKRGAKTESLTVSYSNNFAWQNVAKKMEMAGIDGIEYSLLAMERVGTSTTSGVFWKIDRTSFERSKEWLSQYGGSVKATDPLIYGRDWYRQGSSNMGVRLYDPYETMVREWSPAQTHNLSVNGRSGKTGYNIGLGYLLQNGMTKPAEHDDFKRYNASVNVTTDINKYFSVRAGTIYSDRTKRYPGSASSTSDPWYYMYRWGPISPVGVQEDGVDLREPVAEIRNTKTASIRNIYHNINLGATVNFTKNWDFKFDYTYANQQDITSRALVDFTARDSWASIAAPVLRTDGQGNQVYVNTAGQQVASDAPGAMAAYQLSLITYNPPGGAGNTQNHIYRRSRNTDEGIINAYSTYNLKLGRETEHVFKFMLGLNRVTKKYAENWTQKTGLLDFSNPQFPLATGNVTGSGEEYWESQLGYFGRINYAYMDKYLLEANLRYDGSSKFPTDLRWRWFPSFSAGWILSNENFIESLNLNPVLSFTKFRASWGSVGDQSVPNNLYVPILTNYTTTWLNGDTQFESFRNPLAVQSNITWQNIENLNLGLDLRFLKDKIGVSVDWFQRKTNNMIIPGDALPYTFGTPAPQGNYGNLRTRGWEVAVDFNHRFSNGLSINGLATFSDASTYITQNADHLLPMEDRSIDGQFTGRRYGDIYGYKTDRLYQWADFETDGNGNLLTTTVKVDGVERTVYKLKGENPIYQAKLEGGNFKFGPGDVKYVDLNGDGAINDGSRTVGDMGDLTVIGNSTPRYEYGFRLGADFKGFDMSVFFQGVGKRDVWGNGPLAIAGFNSNDGAMAQAIAGDFWTEDRTDAFYPRAFNLAGSSSIYNMQQQSRYLLNMAYLRMKNLTFGYSIPTPTLKKLYLTKARFYVSFENLVTFDKLRGLPIDPEAVAGYSMFNETNYNGGRTGAGIPTFKTASFGIQLSF